MRGLGGPEGVSGRGSGYAAGIPFPVFSVGGGISGVCGQELY